MFREARARLFVVVAGGGFGAIDPRSELDDIQIDLENPFLGELLFELMGEQCLFDLSQGIPGRREIEVLRELLRDRRGSAREAFVLPGVFECGFHLGGIESVVAEERGVFADQHGAF